MNEYSSNLDSFIDAESQSITDPKAYMWEEIPLSFRKFTLSKQHMNFPRLSDRQYNACYKMLYGVSYKKFHKATAKKRKRYIKQMWTQGCVEYNMGVLVWGKGGGKDTVASLIIAYGVYSLLCLRDPQKFFGNGIGEAIDIVNVAYSSQQAKEVFFEKLKQRVLNWSWLSNKYPIKQSGRYLNETAMTARQIVNIGVNGLLFPKYIRVFSRHSEQESSEGLNILMFVADEIAAFQDKAQKRNGKKMYKMLRSSAMSRFPGVFRGLAISYPRYEEDTILWLYDISQKKRGFFGDKASTFDVNPTKKEEDFLEEKELDPEDYLQKYHCIPPKTVDAFFKYPERIMECVNKSRQPILNYEETLIEHSVIDLKTGLPTSEKKYFIGNEIVNFRLKGMDQLRIPRVAHIDAGLRKDRAALVIAHGEPVTLKMFDQETQNVSEMRMNKTVVDLVMVWQPDKKRNLQVSINNIATILITLVEQFGMRFRRISYDQWNSASSLETLISKGISIEEHNINTEDYKSLRNMIYAGGVDLLDHKLMIHELEKLQFKNGRKVDHTDDGSKETTDCLAGVNRLLNNLEIREEINKSMPRSVLASSSSSRLPMPLGPSAGGVTGDNPLAGQPGVPLSSTRITPMTGVEFDGKGKKTKVIYDSSFRPGQERQIVRFPKTKLLRNNSNQSSGRQMGNNISSQVVDRTRGW